MCKHEVMCDTASMLAHVKLSVLALLCSYTNLVVLSGNVLLL